MKQSLLLIGNTLKRTTCPTCRMSYHLHIPRDKALHAKHHANHVNGLTWPPSLSTRTVANFSIGSSRVSIIMVDKSSRKQISRCRQLLAMVDQELAAPQDGEEWVRTDLDRSKAFVAVISNRAVGVVSTETISEGSWMVLRTGRVVEGQKNGHVRVGISRIWVSHKWRRMGIARRLLESVCGSLVYGMVFKPSEIAFSQPSRGGGELAREFCGVRHKSGEVLISVYQNPNRAERYPNRAERDEAP